MRYLFPNFVFVCFSLQTPIVNATGNVCMSFVYSMFGAGMGRLNVYVDDETGRRLVWTLDGPQSKGWSVGSVNVSTTGDTQVSDIWRTCINTKSLFMVTKYYVTCCKNADWLR